jgi:ankyrin repeat protein
MRLDRPAAEAMIREHPEYLRSHRVMFEAATRDRPDVIALLLDLGVPLEVEDRTKSRALHHAAGANALRAAQFLIDRGAEIDPRETAYGGVPMGWAAHGDRIEMLDLLSRYSRNIWTLCFRGYVDRVREILRENPDLAKQVSSDGITPLWWLPDDERTAMEIVDLLLAAGADPSVRSRQGRTAADWARERGMTEIARRLAVGGEPAAEPEAPEQPEQLARFEALAQDLVIAFERGNPDSMQRLMRQFGREVTWEQLRAAVRERLAKLGDDRPAGYFALPHAQLLVARQAGFETWAALVQALGRSDVEDPTVPLARPIRRPPPEPADVPVEMRMPDLVMRLRDQSGIPTTDVWRMLVACRDGLFDRVQELVTTWPSIIRSAYNYMPPLHLAVREGHLDIVRYLAERGAVNPKYVTYPYKETLQTVALDRGYGEIAQVLDEYGPRADPDRPPDEGGHIETSSDFERHRFERLIGANAVGLVEEMLQKRPELATDPMAFWAEGVLSSPAGNHHRAMVELLMQYGARVPSMTKWGAFYYFKHEDLAAMFLERGADANHMNCHRTTVLHEMARLGEIRKATLLLDHGAAIDAVDQEFRSTPLGFAARWGQREMVGLLLDRGADRGLSGAPWATPLAWARAKGHAPIARML